MLLGFILRSYLCKKNHEKLFLISHNWRAMVKHALCLGTQKQELSSLKCKPLIHTLLYGFAIFTTQTRLDLGPNPSDFIQNGPRMKKLWLFKVAAFHPKCRFSTFGAFRG